MKIVTDSGADLTKEECEAIGVTMLPLKVEVDGVSYQSGVNITPEKFYNLMDAAQGMPKTSTPSIGEFEEVYKRLATEDPDILSIHLSSGLSATYNAAVTAAKMVDNADIVLIDTKTLSAGTAWQVKAAAEMAKVGLTKQTIVARLQQIQDATYTHFTLPDLKYLIAGGRISHLKGLLASLLGIKPVIEVDKTDGKYYDRGKKRSFNSAIQDIPQQITKVIPAGSAIRAQICSAENPSGAQLVKEAMDKVFKVEWLPTISLGTALGAHTGRGLIGVIAAKLSDLPSLS
jgi:DegV family protein with EDD domain